MSERQWSVYKKDASISNIDIPKAAKFWCNTMQCEKDNVSKTMNGLYIKRDFSTGQRQCLKDNCLYIKR